MTQNLGPARETWNVGDRVMWAIKGRDYGKKGIVRNWTRDPAAAEKDGVFVAWDDGTSNFVDRNNLDTAK